MNALPARKVKPNELGSLKRTKSHFTREGIFHGFCQGYWSRRPFLLPALICDERKRERDLIFSLRNGKEGVRLRIIFWNDTFGSARMGFQVWSVALHSSFKISTRNEKCNILYADLKRKPLTPATSFIMMAWKVHGNPGGSIPGTLLYARIYKRETWGIQTGPLAAL